MAAKPTAWERFFANLSPVTQQVIRNPHTQPVLVSEAGADYAAFAAKLSAKTQASMQAIAPEPETPEVSPYKYLAVTGRDGEAPQLQEFPSVEALALFMHEQRNEDVFVFPLYGYHMPFTKLPRRVLMTPHAIWEFDPVLRQLPEVPPDLDAQSDGLLGETFQQLVPESQDTIKRRRLALMDEEPLPDDVDHV